MKRSVFAALAASVLACAAAGCGDTGEDGGGGNTTLTVFAAASLTETFTRLGEEFEKAERGTTVRFNFAGSSTLARQIVQGAPADVFAAADPATMKTVTDAGGAAGEPRVLVRNKLVVAVPRANPAEVKGLDDLSRPGVKVVLCAEQVPCGAAAATALDAAGTEVTPVSRESDVRAVLTKVGLGEADAGLVYRTDALAAGDQVTEIAFPEADKAVNDYPIVALAKAPNRGLAAKFVEMVLSERGRRVLTEAGFEVP